jgi:NADH-quinone oxidoreductase subunit G
MPKLTIDGNEIEVEDGLTVMQACESVGIEIPHFCFHKRLNIAGNCRMCLVEMERAPKLIASCAMPVSEGMVIRTNTPKVKKSREGVMEFLLINHPLDCPICDQAGECDLQDQAFKYGRGKNRYTENKRSVRNKNLGPLVKTEMTRCIHCTRCIRFSTEIAGIPEMGAVNRGEHMEIVSYLEKTLTSELSGNIIDLCPVGALTSKPYEFKARSWELEKTESIDVMDALGSNIRIDSRGTEVMRILPKLNEEINEEWISDKARFSYDGLKLQRIDRPYVRKNDKLVEASWDEALSKIAEKINVIKGDSVGAIAGTTVSAESLFLLKAMLSSLGSEKFDANQFGYGLDTTSRSNYLFNSGIAGCENADICLLIGANSRQVAPVLNARIGKMVRAGKMQVVRIGEADNQTYPIEELGDDISLLETILSDDQEGWGKKLRDAVKPMIIVGDGVLTRSDSHKILSIIHAIIEKYNLIKADWNGFNILHNHASMVAALDLGFFYGQSGQGTSDILKQTRDNKIEALYLLSADEININDIGKDCFVIYQGHHGDSSAGRADVVLPEAAYTEQDGIFVNMEGRPQYARAAISPPGVAKESWEIISTLSDRLGVPVRAYDLFTVREMMSKENIIFAHIDEIIPSEFVPLRSSGKLLKEKLKKVEMNYYMTDAISRASVTMARCARMRLQNEATV